ncbi:MAG: DnaJ domain-containing protein [Clostridia bacterium]|nr:DnaJ domain-containing protein [Clostridia bacterium]
MMDPYKVLGVSPDDSDEKIKQAYRELARKYHPDKYANNPLSDLAQEKMKDINEAYDAITKERARGYGSHSGSSRTYGSSGYGSGYSGDYSGSSSSSSSSYGYSGGADYGEIRMLISMGRLDDAFRALNNISERNAQWYYLMGHIYHRRGMYDLARENYTRAYQMEPGNAEYRSALENMNNAGGLFRTSGGAPANNCSFCDICTGLICLDCLCDCC